MNPAASSRGKPLRVLFVSDVGDTLGGGERSLLSLVQQLDKSRYELHARLDEDGHFATLLRQAHVQVSVRPLGTIARTRNPLKLALYAVYFLHGVLSLARLMRKRRIDIVHINKNTRAIHAVPAARLTGGEAVWHVRNRAQNFGRIGGWLVRHCSRLVFVSESIAVPFRQAFPDAEPKMQIVHEGIDASDFDAPELGTDFRDSVGSEPGERLVGTVGRITPWKGQADFIEAAARIAKRHQRLRFVVVGDCVSSPAERATDEMYRDGLHALTDRLALTDRVVFTGYREDIPAVMHGLDVFVLPSHEEPFGMVVLEAMAAGCAIVATRAGGVPEIVRDEREALLVPPGDPDAIAEAVERLLGDEELAKALGRAAQRRAREEFPLWRPAAQMRQVYAELASERKG